MQLQASIGERVFDIELDGSAATVNGDAVDLRATWLSERVLHLLVDGRSFVVTAERLDERTVRITHRGRTHTVHLKTPQDLLLEQLGMRAEAPVAPAELRAPMPGLVLHVLVEPGAAVAPGAGLLVLEAMKMENELRAERPGTVAAVHVQPGTAVSKNQLLVSFE